MREPIVTCRIILWTGLLACCVSLLGSDGAALAADLSAAGELGLENSAVEAGARNPGYRSDLERIWLTAGPDLEERGEQMRRRALALGAVSLDSPARALIAAGDDERLLARRQLAVRLAPDLPLAHAAVGSAYWRENEFSKALAEYSESFLTIPRHLEASVWLVGTLLVIVAGMLIVGSLAFIFAEGFSALSRAAHDVGDFFSDRMPSFARFALVCSVAGVPVLLGEGVLGVALLFLSVGIVYGRLLDRAVLVVAACGLVVGLYPCLEASGKLLTSLNADPMAAASLALVRGTETPQQLALLLEADGRGDPLVEQILAVRARRLGNNHEAAGRFRRIAEENPSDPFALAILGNIAFEEGRTQEAIGLYEEGRRGRGESAALMFDLAQAYAKVFRMEDGEFAMAQAQEIDGPAVAEFLGFGDSNFVADPPFPIDPIRRRMVDAASGKPMARSVAQWLAPGRLGEEPRYVAGGLAVAILVGLLLQGRFQHASGCLRCGRRICVRCDGEVWSPDLCGACHHLFHKPEETDHELREARIEVLRAREDRLEKLGVMASILLPGFAGMRANRPDLAFSALLLFAGSVFFLVWHEGVVPDPMAVGAGGTFVLGAGALLVCVVYLGVLFNSLISERRG
ncbi:MAG: tetratricopeptide repeat protein [Myxococcota bacterium]|nr:tetratricopeptide repeat protein [Myxococcota bacterium]